VTGVEGRGAHQSPSQTVGPFFGIALPWAGGEHLVADGSRQAVRLHGRVADGAGGAVPDAVVELWQADHDGRPVARPGSLRRGPGRAGGGFTGFGRAATDPDGGYGFVTVLPGAPSAGAARFVVLAVFARGLVHHLLTRAYLAPRGEEVEDALLRRVEPARRGTLLAREDGPGSYRFDIHLQGPHETVFLDHREAAPAPGRP